MGFWRLKSPADRILGKVSSWIVLTGLLLLLLPALPAGAESYVDDFSPAPFSGTVGSFTTGTALEGLDYDGTNVDFTANGVNLSGLATVIGAGDLVITSRAGGSFKFTSLWVDTLEPLVLFGTGPEPFSINIPGGSIGTYGPSGGKTVTSVTLESAPAAIDFDIFMDDVTVDFADTTKPDVTINKAGGQADPTNSSPINFTVVFSEAVTGFTTGDVTVGGTANPTTGTVTGSGTTYNVAVSGMTGDGTVTATIAAGVAQDAASNTNNASTSTDNTVTYDTTKLDVTINQAGGQADPTNVSPVVFTVTFDEEINLATFKGSDVVIAGTAATGDPVIGWLGLTSYSLSVSVTSDGTVTASIPAGGISDYAGNTNNASTSTDNTVTYDTTNPTPVITQAGGQADPTSATPVNFNVDFGEDVTGFADNDIDMSASTTPGTLAAVVSGGPQSYNVAISGMTGTGIVSITFSAAAAQDLASNNSDAPTLTDNEVTYNNLDYGDAPDPLASTAGRYPTLQANGGPRHIIDNNLRMGPSVDGEPDGQPTSIAQGDDNDGNDDEDGVAPGQLIIGQGQTPSIVVTLTNQTGAQATVSGWIDYDRDGIFEPGEKATAAVNHGDTQATLDFPAVPMDASGKSFARFRISTNGASVAGPTGEAPNGEVEDYEVEISNAPTISGKVTDGFNPFPNVTITFSHDSHTVTTAADGTYAYTVPYNTTTTVTPSHDSVKGWNPTSRLYSNITADQSDQDFVVDENQDGDGVPPDEEKGPEGTDSSYDGNGDGIPDFIQDHVSSLHTHDGNGYVTLACPDSVSLENVRAVANPSPADAPANVVFPLQFFEFEITGMVNGGATTLTLYLSNEVEINTYWKFGPTPDNHSPHWYEFLFDGETGAEIVGNTIILHFVDGKRGDDDLTANGVVVDQGGPGFSALAIPIPALSQWGMMLLALILCAVGVIFGCRSRSRPA